MVSKENKVAASRAYLHHIADIGALRDNIDAYMFVARYTGCGDAIAVENVRRLDAMTYEINDARARIGKLEGEPRQILELIAFEGRNYTAIANKVGYSYSSVKRLARDGMKALYEYLPAEWR